MSIRTERALFVIAVALCVAIFALRMEKTENERLKQALADRGYIRAEEELLYRATLCPLDWKAQIIQRYDDRDWRGRIIKKTWIRKCI